ncbi:glycosyl hydrolase family 95 catalytic domain-containing protein [Pedobacter africanus]|uniref:Glycosyl hydrolase family 95 catalytic domain-containing protein n=1 Tax=Pedobacter africanus TaxID=151894 RepID=A0A1W1YP88_9SPHI|nr:glycoside hydrolase [Pedobacter africanus]SMC37946.1 hypothetical protein SAMN04488524_0077 [Pedobacter africanus]
MKSKFIAITMGLALSAATVYAQAPPAISSNPSSMIRVDYKKLVSRADLDYSEPVSRSEAGMPIGNGTMGTLLWTGPSQLHMQLNRVDVFASNSASNNFFQRNTDYCGGTAYADLDFGMPLFNKPDFKQQLSCYEGLSTLRGKDVSVKALAWNKTDVIALRVSDKRPSGAAFSAALRMLRLPVTRRGNHTAVSRIAVHGDYIVLTQEFKEDDYYCGSAVVMGISGTGCNAELSNESTARLQVSTKGQKDFTVYMSSAAGFDPAEDLVKTAIVKLEQARKLGFEGLYASNKQWWADFWSRSFVSLHSKDAEADFVEKNYTYYLYVMGSSSRGAYPTKFNGMLWTTGGDQRKWGANFWGANQSCLYNALFPTNHLELMDPMFNMYSNAYPSFGKSAEQQWGSKGIYIPETVGFDGEPVLPDDIAAEMRELYLKKKNWQQRSQRFIDYAETKQPFLSRWNWKKDTSWVAGKWPLADRGSGPYSPVNHIFSRGAKIAYQYWQRYEYTGDMDWLRQRAYPMLKGIAEFYRNFPNLRKENGRYHIYHVNDNESIWGGHNTVEEIASMKGIFPAAIKAAELLGTDQELRKHWESFISDLSPLSSSKAYPETAAQPEYWVGSLPPLLKGNGQRRPDGNTMPVWFFDLCNPGGDPEMLKIAQQTYDGYFREGGIKAYQPYVLSKIPAAGAVLGRSDAIRYLVPSQIRRKAGDEVLANRMDLSEGFYTTNIQRLGRAADALHPGLLQTAPESPAGDPVIRLFPAWPKEWDAAFSLLGRGNFLITSAILNGEISFVELHSQLGSECRIRNPWPNSKITVYKNGRQTVYNEDLLVIQTQKGDRLILLPEGRTPEQAKLQI